MKKSKFNTQFIIYVLLIIGDITMLLPFIWLMLSTFKPNAEINAVPPSFFPKQWTFENYGSLLERFNINRYFLNSLFLAVTKTAIIISSESLFATILSVMLGFEHFKISLVIGGALILL